MVQNYSESSYNHRNIAGDDLQAMENNFQCLKTSFSGSSAPPSPVAFQSWGDESGECFKIRSWNNLSWWGLMHGDSSRYMWVGRDDTLDGYAIHSGATDCLLAVSGGSTYTTPGLLQGSWWIPSWHYHCAYKNALGAGNYIITYHSDKTQWNLVESDCAYANVGYFMPYIDASKIAYYWYQWPQYFPVVLDAYTNYYVNVITTWRPYAFNATLQYLDI